MFWKLYVLELLHCVQLGFVTLRHVTFTLCCFTLCSNIQERVKKVNISIRQEMSEKGDCRMAITCNGFYPDSTP
jgi:hypothetical protein